MVICLMRKMDGFNIRSYVGLCNQCMCHWIMTINCYNSNFDTEINFFNEFCNDHYELFKPRSFLFDIVQIIKHFGNLPISINISSLLILSSISSFSFSSSQVVFVLMASVRRLLQRQRWSPSSQFACVFIFHVLSFFVFFPSEQVLRRSSYWRSVFKFVDFFSVSVKSSLDASRLVLAVILMVAVLIEWLGFVSLRIC